MAGGVSGRRYDHHLGQDLGLAVELFVVQPGCVHEFGQGVVRCVQRGFQFDALGEDRSAGKRRVAAAVVEVKMTVDQVFDVLDVDPDAGQRRVETVAAGAVVGVDVGGAAHAGIDQEEPGGVVGGGGQA